MSVCAGRTHQTCSNRYMLARLAAEIKSRGQAEGKTYISERTLAKIETGERQPKPDEVLAMADAYSQPTLAMSYCQHECPIGQRFAQPFEERDIAVSALMLLRAYNEASEAVREQYVAICDDNLIESHELPTFEHVYEKLSKLEDAISSIKLLAAQYIPDALQKQKPAPAQVAERRVSYTKRAASAAR
ncbi:MAG: helix-turn-helix domain-containing protein [Firmicutes bacterium]|nr:helix-turn-helix domain-containing protein [Bacillota bacterium]